MAERAESGDEFEKYIFDGILFVPLVAKEVTGWRQRFELHLSAAYNHRDAEDTRNSIKRHRKRQLLQHTYTRTRDIIAIETFVATVVRLLLPENFNTHTHKFVINLEKNTSVIISRILKRLKSLQHRNLRPY